jgi:hypothetical protein
MPAARRWSGPEARDPFSSVAAALVQAGVRGVVAMAWSLYVSGAQEFLPAFYQELFTTGGVIVYFRLGLATPRATQ